MESIPFKPFDPHGEVTSYSHGRLPHLRQRGCTYFVTFRLADSLPQSFRSDLLEKRNTWLCQQGIDPNGDWKSQLKNLPCESQRQFERESAAYLNDKLDKGYGSCLLQKADSSKIVADALMFFHGQRAWVGDFVIMPNHVHVLLTPVGEWKLEDLMQSVKGFSARQINKASGNAGPVWSKESYDHIVRDGRQLKAFEKYIQNNPTKAGLEKGNYRLCNSETIYEGVI